MGPLSSMAPPAVPPLSPSSHGNGPSCSPPSPPPRPSPQLDAVRRASTSALMQQGSGLSGLLSPLLAGGLVSPFGTGLSPSIGLSALLQGVPTPRMPMQGENKVGEVVGKGGGGWGEAPGSTDKLRGEGGGFRGI